MPVDKIRKLRADQLVCDQGLVPSREQAKRCIMAGQVFVGNPPVRVEKPGHPYPSDAIFTLAQQERLVSRGAYKLLTALVHFQISVQTLFCLDA